MLKFKIEKMIKAFSFKNPFAFSKFNKNKRKMMDSVAYLLPTPINGT